MVATKTKLIGLTVIAEICLYGTSRTGAGYLVTMMTGDMFGQHQPDVTRSFTEAVFKAVAGVWQRAGGYEDRQAWRELGAVRVFHPGGEFYSDIPLSEPCPNYGSLTSQPVTEGMGHVISIQELLAHQVARREVAAVSWSIQKGPGL